MSRKPFTVLAFFIALYLLIWSVPASANDDDDWDKLTATLGLENPLISKDEYTLKVLEFDSYGMVLVEVLKNGVNLEDAVLGSNSSGWCYMDSRNLRLKACNITDQETIPMFGSLYCPKAEIIFETKKHVEENVTLELDLEADKDEYFLDEEVIVEMELRNTGEVKTDNLRLEVDSDGLLIRDGGPERLMLSKGSTKEIKLRFKFPNTVKEKYNITVSVTWEDRTGQHSISQTEEFEVIEPLEIYKNTGIETFSGSPVYVTVSVENSQARTMRGRLVDLLPATFTLVNDSIQDENPRKENADLSWDFVLAPEERKTFSYYIRSEELGAHRAPQAHAYASLGGQSFVKSSDMENIITVYENISYKEYKAGKGALIPSLQPSDEVPDDKNVSYFSGEVTMKVKIK